MMSSLYVLIEACGDASIGRHLETSKGIGMEKEIWEGIVLIEG